MSTAQHLRFLVPGKRTRIAWNVSRTRKRDAEGELRNLCWGVMVEALPAGTDTPAGFYHNEPVHSTLEERYYGHRGMAVPTTGFKPKDYTGS